MPDIGKVHKIGHGGRAARQRVLHFGTQACGHLGMVRQQVSRPGQGTGQRFVSGNQQRGNLLPELPAAESCTIPSVRREEEREHILVMLRLLHALYDQPIHDLCWLLRPSAGC